MAVAATAALLLGLARPAIAIESIRLQAESIEVEVPGQGRVTAHDAVALLGLPGEGRSRVRVQVPRFTLPAALTQQSGAVRNFELDCADPVVSEPEFSCAVLQLRVHAAALPPIAMSGRADFNSGTGAFRVTGQVPAVAGSTLAFEASGSAARIDVDLSLPGVKLATARELASRWVTLPADLELQGEGDVAVRLAQDGQQAWQATATVQLRDLGFQNAEATWIAEKVTARIEGSTRFTDAPLPLQLRVEATGGQFLGGVVLLDFDRNPLEAGVQGTADASQVLVETLDLRQRDLAQLSGTGTFSLSPFSARRVELELQQLQFPAAYASYMQLLLATTPFNLLQSTGSASGRITVADNAPVAADLRIESLSFSDPAQELDVQDVNGELHWSTGGTGPPRPSYLSWASSRGWGIEGAITRIDFATSDRNFQLLRPARLPFFDGALVINTLRAQDIGLQQMEGDFDAVIEPISVGPIARALGWPEFSGQLSGRIPGLTYRNEVLTLSGNVEADVFDGRVTASNLSVTRPFSAWPQLHADIVARNLDLNLITSTFEFGSITGRLDVDLLNLTTFNWSPTAFDLRMATPARDRSRRRISQRAVQNLSSIGGGGGGVAAALQSGVLRFFDEFRYSRLGISCRLRNDVCQMDGVGPAGSGYYIVQGSGLPRINIIGNEHRVDWPRLVAQVSTALASSDGLVIN